MSPRSISDSLVLPEPPLLRIDETIRPAVRRLLDSQLPALPVIDEREHFVGIFGEREFMNALFPGYLRELRHASFVTRSLDEVLETRSSCAVEPVGRHMNTEHIDVGPGFSDAEVAEIFMHHRVLVIPVVADGRVEGLVTRTGFFRALTERFLERQ
jgi:CBS domain-containing protein